MNFIQRLKMEKLSGHQKVDKLIREEIIKSGLPIKDIKPCTMNGLHAFVVQGGKGVFIFSRINDSWIVTGENAFVSESALSDLHEKNLEGDIKTMHKITSEKGLKLFVETLIKHGVIVK